LTISSLLFLTHSVFVITVIWIQIIFDTSESAATKKDAEIKCPVDKIFVRKNKRRKQDLFVKNCAAGKKYERK